jgi:hypothetical protein
LVIDLFSTIYRSEDRVEGGELGVAYREGERHTNRLLVGKKYLLTPWRRVLEKLTGLQLVKKFLAFYGT